MKTKTVDDVLIKYTGTRDNLTNYWTNDLFTVAKMNGPAIIVNRKRDGNVFTRNISMVKKYKHIVDSDDHSDINSSGSAEMNIENWHSHNRGSNMDNLANADSTKNVRRLSRTRNTLIRPGEPYAH